MKNIYISETNRGTRLKILFDNLELSSRSSIFNYGVHIYIISSEEIKVGDWCIDLDTNNVFKLGKLTTDRAVKIILTTDEYLVNEGVQAIDDEFLEWFVKNPTCDFVEVQYWVNYYKIFIPQEEPKQETLEEFSKRFANTISTDVYYNPKIAYAINQGGKWQEKIMYSEEEVYELLKNYQSNYSYASNEIGLKKWFEEFKKK